MSQLHNEFAGGAREHWQHERGLLNLYMIQYFIDNNRIVYACNRLFSTTTRLARFDIDGLLPKSTLNKKLIKYNYEIIF